MIEVEVYARGIRDTANVIALDREIQSVAGLRYKVDTNHDIVYMEMDAPVVTVQDVRALFRRVGIEGQFVGRIPPDLKPKTKTQPLKTSIDV